MKKRIIIRFGDMMLKGKNKGMFNKKLKFHVLQKFKGLEVGFDFTYDRIFIDYQESDEKLIINNLHQIPGIYSFNVAYVANSNLEDIIKKATEVLNKELDDKGSRLKISTRRHDKTFPMTSIEITQKISGPILENVEKEFIVDVKNPTDILHIAVRKEVTYIFLKPIKGLGGYPFGTGGKGLLMMSGGIDSSVAAFLAMKQGIDVELFHFESTPLTPLESVQKVIDLAKILANYTANGKIKLHLVPFTKIHEEILSKIHDPYIITIMRRMMYRLGERYANERKILCLLNGESVGQVASQTLHSMKVVEEVTKIPLLRPLITYDKNDIIKIAKKINTFETSIQPFNDCCSIYVPKSPVTRPKEIYAQKYEKNMDYEQLLIEALENIETIEVFNNDGFVISNYGFSVLEAISEYKKEMRKNENHIKTKQDI